MIDFNKVFVDTAVFIYFLENNVVFGEKARSFFNFSYKNDKEIITSVITYLEFCVKPYRDNNLSVIDIFKQLLQESGIKSLPININHSDEASKLRAKYLFLKNFDALQLAVAIHENCQLFITNDKQRGETIQLDNKTLINLFSISV